MSSPASSPDSGDAANGDLAALRAALDGIDDAMHDLLMRRAAVVERVALAGKPAALRPGREAGIIRRLVGRHAGALPVAVIVRIWRELLAGTTSMQGGFSLSVGDSEPSAALTHLAREHFGALTPLRAHGSPGQAMADVSQGHASVAVLPFPSDRDGWWVSLMHHEPRLHIIALLPFWKPRPEGTVSRQAVAVASAPPDPSGNDRSFLGLECDADISRAKLSSVLGGVSLTPLSMVVMRDQGAPIAHVLSEIGGFLADDDPRLQNLGAVFRRPVVLGSYAVPLTGAP